MGSPTAEELNGLRETKSYDDGTVVRVFCMRTTHDSYPSGWAYNLHYGTTEPDPPRTLDDGTIRRYDNAHEATKGHELHPAGARTRKHRVPRHGRSLEAVLERDPETRVRYPRAVIHNDRPN